MSRRSSSAPALPASGITTRRCAIRSASRASNTAPASGAGAYGHGDKNNLGNSLEFQSGLDLFYRLNGGWRVGATLRHVSNGGTGDTNPGIETLAVLVAMPLH